MGSEDTFLESIEAPSVLSPKVTCQSDVKTGGEASVIIMEDTTSGKRKGDFSSCEHPAKRSNIKVDIDEVSSGDVVDMQEEDVKMTQSVQPNCVGDKVCEMLIEENLDKSTCTEENKATPSSSETNASNEHTAPSLTRSPTCCSRRKLIVLDVNGLLADIVPIGDVPDKYKPDTIISGKAVFKRPFCDEFLEFCFQRFSVGVWSSRTKRNVNSVVDFLMGELRHNLLFCWDQSRCTQTGYNTVENSNKPLVLKEIKRLWEKSEPDLPWERGEYNQSNILLLDDSPYKALCNPPYTAIFPRTYQYRDENDNSLGPGGDLYLYLEGLAEAVDVPVYVKQNPFGQQPITEEDASWDFYFKVKESSSSIPSQSSLEDVKCTSVTLKVDEIGGENTGDTGSADSPSCLWRTRKGDRSESRNLSPVRGRSRSRSRSPRMWCGGRDSLSHGRSRRSMSPSYSRRSEFSSDKMRGDKTRPRECFAFIRGHCSKGVYCRYLHHESDDIVKSRSYRCKQQYHDVRPTSKSVDIPGKIEDILPDGPVDERSKPKTHDMDQDSRVLEKRECLKEEVSKSQLYQRSDKVPCHYFWRGNCNWGESCRYLHLELDKIDGSTSYLSEQQDQYVRSSSNGSDMHGNTETVPPERSVIEHSDLQPQDLDQGVLVMEETNGMKEKFGIFTNGFSDKMSGDKEPCRKFKVGNCHRGASCKYLHVEPKSGEIPNEFSGNTRREEEPCRKFKIGNCHRGASCRYLHVEPRWSECRTQDLDQGVREETEGKKEEFGKLSTQFSGKEPCRNFKFGNCHRGASCTYLHLEPGMIGSSEHHWNKYPYAPRSSGFVVSNWKTETPQGLVHDDNEAKTQDLEQGTSEMVRNVHDDNECKTHDLEQGTRTSEMVRYGSKDDLGESSSELWHEMRKGEPCHKFMRGACHFGANCKYRHTELDKPLIQDGESSSQLWDTMRREGLCRKFIQGACHFGANCKYRHTDLDLIPDGEPSSQLLDTRREEPCRKFMRGACYSGANCRYRHAELDKHEASSQLWDTTTREELCRKFMRGACHFGANCKYRHSELDKPLIPDGESSSQLWDTTRRPGPCRKFMQGACHFGANCKYRHTELDKPLIPDGEPSSHLWNTTTREELCRKFMRGACHFGVNCKYLHIESDRPLIPECDDFKNGKCHRPFCRYRHIKFETDRSIADSSRQQCQNSPSISKLPVCWETENVSREGVVFEDNEPRTCDVKNHDPVMEEEKDLKEELGKSITQPCDEQNHLGSEPSVILHGDGEDEKVPDDVAHWIPTPV